MAPTVVSRPCWLGMTQGPTGIHGAEVSESEVAFLEDVPSIPSPPQNKGNLRIPESWDLMLQLPF